MDPFLIRTRYLPKENITYGSTTISYVQLAGAIFVPSMSVGSEEDNVTCLNLVVAVSVAPQPLLSSWSWLVFVGGVYKVLRPPAGVREKMRGVA